MRRILAVTAAAVTFAGLGTFGPLGLPSAVRPVLADTAWQPWTPDWSQPNGFADINDYSDQNQYTAGEYGIDVPLGENTPIYAPGPGTVSYVQNGCAWSPGRLILKLDSGPIVAFGHVVSVASGHVSGGQQIAYVSPQVCYGPHVEFMYSSSGIDGGKDRYVPTSAAAGSCPHLNWSDPNGLSVDPCSVLAAYMRGTTPSPNGNAAVNARGDFNGDGYSDLAVLYNYGGTTTGLFVWPGSSTGIHSTSLVWKSTSFSFGATGGLAIGDFNRDGYADLAAPYNYGGTTTGLFVWPGSSTGIHSTSLVWKSTSFSFGATGRLTVGDFNGDGYRDIAALYNYGGTTTGLFAWPGSSTGIHSTSLVWKSTTFSFGATGGLAIGDFNRDGYADVAALYNYGGTTTGLFVWPGSSSGLYGTSLVWQSTTFSFGATSRLAFGDFNADGYADLAILYNYGGTTTGLFVWPGSSLGLSVTSLAWKSTTFSFGATGGLAMGDFNGDGYTDLGALYNYGGNTTGLFAWPGSSSGPRTTSLVWKSTSFSFGATSPLAFGNFNWDAYDDVTVLYNYGGTTTGLFVWSGSSSSLDSTSLVWKSTTFSFGACKMA